MIKTDFLKGQGLGNQLWVYAAVRGISKNLKMEFNIGGEEFFKGSSFLELNLTNPDIAQKQQPFTLFKEKQYFDPELQYYASDYDSRVESLGINTYIEGLFQSEKYFYEYHDFLSDWIPLSDTMKGYSQQFSETCVLNIRGGEYKRHKNLILPKSYWEDGMLNVQKKTSLDKFLIVTDDPSYAKALFPNMPILNGGVAECYAALYGANSLIVSNSSFSYFPIKTRKDFPLVIAPYQWSRFGNKHNRWAAPANLYKDWSWQDVYGNIHNYEECEFNRMQTLNYYKSEYNVLTKSSVVGLKNKFKYVPVQLKRPIKLILSMLLPKHFGK
jgi:hypothetical protein